MKYNNATYVRDDINGQFGGVERIITIDGITFEIDINDKNFSDMFSKVIERGRLVNN